MSIKEVFSTQFVKIALPIVIIFLMVGFIFLLFLNEEEKIVISPESHFFSEPTKISIDSTNIDSEYDVFYTTDGSTPTISSTRYEDPIKLDQTSTLTIAQFKDEEMLGEPIVHPVFIQTEHSLPVVSIVTDEKNLWDEEIGIYTDENYEKKGKEWQRPATIHYFEEDEDLGFSRDIGLRIHGGGTRSFPQKSFRIIASNTDKDDYISYPLFGEDEKVHSFILRNAGGDWDSAFMRDALTHRIVSKNSVLDTQRDRPVVVYLNGEYWGLYYAREKQDEYYLSEKYDLDISRISILDIPHAVGGERGQAVFEYGNKKTNDDVEKYNSLLASARKCNDCAEYHYFNQFFDMENLIDYNLYEIHFANYDWPYGNNKSWRYQPFEYGEEAPIGQEGKFRWLLFDTDVGMGYNSQTEEEIILAAKNGDYGRFVDDAFPFRNLFNDETFLREYLNRYADLLNTTLQPESVIQEIDTLASELESEMPRQIERWKDDESPAGNKVSQSIEEWQEEVELLRVYAKHRENMMRENTREQFGLNKDISISLDTNDPTAGDITINTISIPGTQLPWTGKYFADQDITITAEPNFGYSFVKWEDSGASDTDEEVTTNSIRKITTNDIQLKAIFKKQAWYEAVSSFRNSI